MTQFSIDTGTGLRCYECVETAIKSAKRSAKRLQSEVTIYLYAPRFEAPRPEDNQPVASVWPSGQVDLTWLGSQYA